MIYIRENIPSKLLEKRNFSNDIEGLFVELNFRKVKWLLFGTNHPLSQNDIYYFNESDKATDTYSNVYMFNDEVKNVLDLDQCICYV